MMSRQTFFLPDAAATFRFGEQLGRSLSASTVLLLEGNLGSGKTTLTQGIAHGLGIEEAIASPTFTLVNEYPEGRVPLYHFDLYRLNAAEVEHLHLETYSDPMEYEPGIMVIEWSERLSDRPDRYLQIHLSDAADEGRVLRIEAIGMALEPQFYQALSQSFSPVL
jgi:tRNA threonylcarbamoyladenosine biosynthesis protein TsaE